MERSNTFEKERGIATLHSDFSIAYLPAHIIDRFSITGEGDWTYQEFQKVITLMIGRMPGPRSYAVMELLRRLLGIFLSTVSNVGLQMSTFPWPPDSVPSECKHLSI
jgi:hypothetical protein